MVKVGRYNYQLTITTMDKEHNITIRDYVDTRFEAVILNASQRFDAQQLALKDALMAQEKGTSLALVNTEKAIDKASAGTDKRFDELSEKISTAIDSINKSTGAQGIYVTHGDLQNSFDKFRIDMESVLKPMVKQLSDVTVFMNSQTGQQKGAGTSWQTMVTIISVCGSLIAIFFALSK